MYKELHTQVKEPLAEPYCRKGSFACLVPIGVIMVTSFVYYIQHKKRKNNPWELDCFFLRKDQADSSLLNLMFLILCYDYL